MSADPYSKRVRELFDAPAHAGHLDGASSVEVSEQGVRVRLYAKIEDGEARALRFRVWGCPHAIAAAEAFCAGYEGRAVADLLDFSASDLMQSLSVPVEKTGRILVIEDAVRSLGSVAGGVSEPDD